MRRATAVAATASGGATTAPNATAAAKGTGSNHHTTNATANVLNSTNPTDREAMVRRLSLKSTSEVRSAAV